MLPRFFARFSLSKRLLRNGLNATLYFALSLFLTFCFLVSPFSELNFATTLATDTTAPSGLNVQSDGTITVLNWVGVSGATSYKVEINGALVIEYESQELNNMVELSAFVAKPAVYTIFVSALNESGILGSSSLSYTVSGVLSAPNALYIDGQVLRWDEVENASNYAVTLSKTGSETTSPVRFLTVGNYFDLTAYSLVGANLNVSVQALAAEDDAVFSNSAIQTVLLNYRPKPKTPLNLSAVYFDNKYVLSFSPSLNACGYYVFVSASQAEQTTPTEDEIKSGIKITDCLLDLTDKLQDGVYCVFVAAVDSFGTLSDLVHINLYSPFTAKPTEATASTNESSCEANGVSNLIGGNTNA